MLVLERIWQSIDVRGRWLLDVFCFGASADHRSEEEVGGNWKAGVREVGLRRGDLLGPEGGWASSYTANNFCQPVRREA